MLSQKLNRIRFIDGGKRATQIPKVLKMRIVIAVIAIALLTVTAHAQGAGKGKRHQQASPKTAEDQAKKKAAERAYKDALKNIPASNEKLDPWQSVR